MVLEYSIQNIPDIGLGTYKLKTQDEINYSMEHAITAGYRMFDTAELYKNEHLISEFIENRLPEYNLSRKHIWITTKVAYYTMLDGNECKIRNVIESSIKYFKGYVDLFLIHASNPNDIMTWHLLREYQKAGKIRYIGISNYNTERLNTFINAIGNEESRLIYSNQIEFNPFLNRADLLEKCKSIGIRVIAYGSLYKSNDYILGLSKKYDRPVENILLQWAKKKGIVVIPMSRNNQHIRDNYNALSNVIPKVSGKLMSKELDDAVDDYLDEVEMDMLDSLDEGYTRYRKHL
jgi:diketogulonate reductase-like aldo/keto reductase